MKIMYWVTLSTLNGTVNFSVTGEGTIEEECRADAERRVDEETPFKPVHLQFQKFYSYQEEYDEN